MKTSLLINQVTACFQNLRHRLVLACALLFATPLVSTAATITLNFDSVDASLGGVDATAYLASNGITLSGVSPGGSSLSTGLVGIYDDRALTWVAAASGHNFLLQQVSGAPAESFTMNFSTPLDSLSFTRIANTSSNLVAGWTATAYTTGSTALSSASEGFGTGGFSPVTYTLTGPDIVALTISANGFGMAGVASATIDNLVLNTSSVPEPATDAALFGVGALGLALLRRKLRAGQAGAC